MIRTGRGEWRVAGRWLGRAICFLTRHRFPGQEREGRAVCSRCGVACSHSVLVYRQGHAAPQCIDCGMVPQSRKEETSARRVLTLWRCVQALVLRSFGWDAGPLS